jgi:hypothetical protein
MGKIQHNFDITHIIKKKEIGTLNSIVFLIQSTHVMLGLYAFNFSSFCAKEHNPIHGLKQYITEKAI